VNLEKIVTGSLVLTDETLTRCRIRCSLAVDRRRTDNHRRAEQLAALELVAKHELIRGAKHRANRGDAVCDVEEEDVAIRLLTSCSLSTSDMRVHLGEPWHQILAAAVYASRVGGNGRGGGRAHPHDLPVAHNYRLAFNTRSVSIGITETFVKAKVPVARGCAAVSLIPALVEVSDALP
jgi:hypothetical protein